MATAKRVMARVEHSDSKRRVNDLAARRFGQLLGVAGSRDCVAFS